MIPSDLMPFWLTLGRPLTRLLFAMCIGPVSYTHLTLPTTPYV